MKRTAMAAWWLVVGAAVVAGCASDSSTRGGSASAASRASDSDPSARVRAKYTKSVHRVPMRDGARLHTIVYAPKDDSRDYPVMLFRTPYSIGPYEEDEYRRSLGPSRLFEDEGYIFVYQDVRGRFMSEGDFVNMTPHVPEKRTSQDIDESTDTWDTIEWVVHNVPNNNGRVGQWGISYPGFYTAAGMIDHHPSLIASSPQAPIADWWWDDFHHHGAFFLPHAFNFLASFGVAREGLTTEWNPRFDHGTPDGYQFFLDLGPLKNVNEKYFKGEIAFWNDIVEHPNYDEFWQSMNILPHLRNTPPAVMTVGGWFDAEDLYGPLQIYREVERHNPQSFNMLVMGPWPHGGWARGSGNSLGNIHFGQNPSEFYQRHIEFAFFNHYLNDGPDHGLPEAFVWETGENQWRQFDEWPPAEAEPVTFYLTDDLGLSQEPPTESGYDEYISDPAKPVPFSEEIRTGMTRPYMTDDQRFASRRPDVLAYQTAPFEKDFTIAGPIEAELWVSTSGTDSDWIVKIIDVFPPEGPAKNLEDLEEVMEDRLRPGGYQMMVRSEVIRGRFRNSHEHPEPFSPNEPTLVKLPLQDVLHTFKKGHRMMVQIQSTWFPLVDRNPQTFVENVFLAEESDFQRATQRVYWGGARGTQLRSGTMND